MIKSKKPPDLTKPAEKAVSWRVFDQAVSEVKARNVAVPAEEIEAEIDEALAAVRTPGVALDRAALKEAAAKVNALLQREGLTEADLDEITRDFRAGRKTASK
jgi:hypothetical protein